jgi:excisionase family DNA binding protein
MTVRIRNTAMDRHARRPRLVRTRQAADYLCVSSWSIRKLVAEGKLPVLQDGHGRFLIDVYDLDDYVDRAKVTRERPVTR